MLTVRNTRKDHQTCGLVSSRVILSVRDSVGMEMNENYPFWIHRFFSQRKILIIWFLICMILNFSEETHPKSTSPLGLSRLCSATFEQLLASGATFCGSSNLEQILPFWATFEQNIRLEHISSTKKSTISSKTSIHANLLNVYQFFLLFFIKNTKASSHFSWPMLVIIVKNEK